MDYIVNQYIFRNNLALSFEPLSPENFAAFSEKPVGDNQARREIIVFNENNEPVYEFKSGREMARYFGIVGKVASTAISGIYQNFTLVAKSVSYRQEILVFDRDFRINNKIEKYNCRNEVCKGKLYTLKTLLETNKPHQPLAGKIFKYSKPQDK